MAATLSLEYAAIVISVLYRMLTDDREPLKQGSFLNNIKGKLCADKGYIGKTLQTSVIQ